MTEIYTISMYTHDETDGDSVCVYVCKCKTKSNWTEN